MKNCWEVYAVKYTGRSNRTRAESFVADDNSKATHPIDCYVWLLRSSEGVILVDTGYDEAEGERRRRPIHRSPSDALGVFGLTPKDIRTVILTHLHYDHAGGLDFFPHATVHLQSRELSWAKTPGVCIDSPASPYTRRHIDRVAEMVRSGRAVLHQGESEIADGISVHLIGGHSKGLQVVRIRTGNGFLCLASDAAHYYENFICVKPFPIIADLQEMLTGFDRIRSLAGNVEQVVPGHDPLVSALYPSHGESGYVWRLDKGLLPGRQILLPTAEAHENGATEAV